MQGFTSLTTVFLFSVNTFVQECVPKKKIFLYQIFPNFLVSGTILGLKCIDGIQKVSEN